MLLLPWRLAYFEQRSFVQLVLRNFSSQPLQSLRAWQVSSFGRCCSSRGIITPGFLNPSGYRFVKIAASNWPVHRLVILAFQGPPPDGLTWQVHHKDADKANNRLDNLEYVTQSQNMLHSYARGTRKNGGKASSKPVAWRQLGSEAWIACGSVKEAAQQLDLHRSTVSRACSRQASVKGFEFRFQEASVPVLPGEEWRPMLGPTAATPVAGRTVSSLGRVTSQRGVIGRGCLALDGYYNTTVLTALGRVQVPVHRLVALAFLEPPESDCRVKVNHKDLDKSNNRADNLEWVSHAENLAHFYANAAVVRAGGLKPICSRLRGSNDNWELHPSIKSAARNLGVHPGNISRCVLGKGHHAGGYEFKLTPSAESMPGDAAGEKWRVVDLDALKRDREARTP